MKKINIICEMCGSKMIIEDINTIDYVSIEIDLKCKQCSFKKHYEMNIDKIGIEVE